MQVLQAVAYPRFITVLGSHLVRMLVTTAGANEEQSVLMCLLV